MKKTSLFIGSFKVLLSAALLGMAAVANAQSITVDDAWVRATVPAQKATGAFLRITVTGANATLVSAASPIAGVTQIHEMEMADGVMRMREKADGIPLQAGEALALKPGGYHIMMMDLKQAVKVGEAVPLTLTVRKADGKQISTTINAEVRALNGQPVMNHGKMH